MKRSNGSRRAPRRTRILSAAALLIFILLYAIPTRWYVLAGATYWDVRSLQAGLDANNTQFSPAARALVQDVRVWRGEFAPLIQIAPNLAWIPHYGGDFAQLSQFAALFDTLADATEPALVLYDALNEKLAQGSSPGAALVQVARDNASEIESARAVVQMARTQYASINPRTLSPEANGVLASADRALNEWDAALQLLEGAPNLLGNDAPRRYLVLAQNNDELRATGGFISAVGVLRVEQGQLSVEWFGDSFAADDLNLIHPPPPAPLQKYMDASQWLVRDSNWYADFPTSADVAETMYAHDHNIRLDGVIAVDTRFMPRLVGAVDGLQLDGQPLDSASVNDLLKASWKPLPPGDMSDAWFASDRKNFLAELFSALMLRMKTGSVHSAALAQALWRGLREKSVQVYSNDAEAEDALKQAGWGGAINAGTGDYLNVVDSNVGFNKVNANVTRAITYRVNPAKRTASVEIMYNNPSSPTGDACDLLKQHKDNTYASMEQSCYWNYVRVLAPRGSQFVSAQGVSDAGVTDDIDSVAAFGGYALIPRDSTGSVRLDYALPESVISSDRYSLTLQQQAGASPAPVIVRIELPKDRMLAGATDNFLWYDASTLEFHELLDRDKMITLYFNSK